MPIVDARRSRRLGDEDEFHYHSLGKEKIDSILKAHNIVLESEVLLGGKDGEEKKKMKLKMSKDCLISGKKILNIKCRDLIF